LNRFREGNRVICMAQHDGNYDIINKVGTIKQHERMNGILVEFDSKIKNGHDGNMVNKHYKGGHCWYINQSKLKLCSDSKILLKLLEAIK